MLRATEAWTFVDWEVDIRLKRVPSPAGNPMSRRRGGAFICRDLGRQLRRNRLKSCTRARRHERDCSSVLESGRAAFTPSQP
jgi:hypothetical protein